MLAVRTTVTLDPDVERLLRGAVRKTGRSFKEVLNRALREALGQGAAHRSGRRFRVRAHPMRLRPGIDTGSLNRLLDEVEIEAFRDKQAR